MPIKSIVADINMDASVFYTFNGIIALGVPDSSLDAVVARNAARLGLKATPDPDPDPHFSFAPINILLCGRECPRFLSPKEKRLMREFLGQEMSDVGGLRKVTTGVRVGILHDSQTDYSRAPGRNFRITGETELNCIRCVCA
jgi:hypothetical protein